MVVKIHLSTDEYICSECGSVVDAKADKCNSCGASFDGTVEEKDNFRVFVKEIKNEDDTQKAVKIFRMLSGSSIFDTQYIENLKKDIKDSDFPERTSHGLVILKHYILQYKSVNEEISELINRMRKEKKDEILSDLNVLEEKERERLMLIEKIRTVEIAFSELLESYHEFMKNKERVLKEKIEELERDAERRKIQAKMLVEKEKELLEREHKLREKEKIIDKELESIESSASKLEGEGISKEEWLAAQKEIQEKLYRIREEVIKKREESAKDKMVKNVLIVLDNLLEKLPDEVIEEFAMSKDFELYRKVMEMYGLGGESGSS